MIKSFRYSRMKLPSVSSGLTKHDATKYIDWESSKRIVLPNLEPSQKTISLRLPTMMLAELKRLANKREVPYQSLLKIFLAERLEEESRRSRTG